MKDSLMTNRKRDLLAIKGYVYYSPSTLERLLPGIKLPYWICSLLTIEAILLDDVVIMGILTVLAAGGTALPRHPIDYLYNFILRKWIGEPKIPRRTKQVRFACFLATLFSGTATIFMINEKFWTAYIFAYSVFFASALVGILNICLPSMLYNLIRYKSIYPPEWKRLKTMMGE